MLHPLSSVGLACVHIAVREAQERGLERPTNCSALSVASALAELLSSLPQPLLPPESYPTVSPKHLPVVCAVSIVTIQLELDANNTKPWSRRFLEQLPPLSYNVFVYMISFFRELLALKHFNRFVSTVVL